MTSINTFRIIIVIAIIFSTTLSCSRNREKEKTEQKLPAEKETEDDELIDSSLDEQYYENEFEKIVNDVGKIQKFTPETFVTITILYRKMTRKWLDEAMALPAEEQKNYLDEENVSFFNAFGITEEQFIKYSQANIDELNKYMEEHPELISELQE